MFQAKYNICIAEISSGRSHVWCLCSVVKLLDAVAGTQAWALPVSLRDAFNAFPPPFNTNILISIFNYAAWNAFIFIFVMESFGD